MDSEILSFVQKYKTQNYHSIKSKEFSIFKKELNIKFGNEVKYYFPKILLGKKKLNTSNLLGNYVFCFHEKFNDVKNLVFSKYIKGLDFASSK